MSETHFYGNDVETSELLAQVDAALGYPRHYTQADFDSGLLRRVGGGYHVPIEDIVTHSCSAVEHVDIDAEGMPTSNRRRLRVAREEDTHRPHFARHRVLRLLNRGSRARLIDVPGIGPARADAIIAARPVGSRWRNIEDLRDAGMPLAVMQAVRDYVLARVGDDDADEGDDAAAVQKVAR